jgi:hypothetical protein
MNCPDSSSPLLLGSPEYPKNTLRIDFKDLVPVRFIVKQCYPRSNDNDIYSETENHLESILDCHGAELVLEFPCTFDFLREKPCGPFGKLDLFDRRDQASTQLWEKIMDALDDMDKAEIFIL